MSLIQTAFNAAYLGIIAQGKACFDVDNDTCVYNMWGEDGTMLHCAVGWAVPVEREDVLLGELAQNNNLPALFLDRIQTAHDGVALPDNLQKPADFLDAFKTRMAGVAKEFELEIPMMSEGEAVRLLKKAGLEVVGRAIVAGPNATIAQGVQALIDFLVDDRGYSFSRGEKEFA